MGSARGVVAFLAVGVLAAAIGIAAYATDALQGLEYNSVDARFSTRGTQTPSPQVAVVAIDDKTFSKLGLQWPFPRSVHGKLIDRLITDGAKAIAYDVQFTEPTVPREDNALVEAVARAGNVVLVTTEVGPHGSTKIFGGGSILRQIGARPANSTVIPDADGAIRHFPYAYQGLKGFAVVAAEVGSGKPVAPDEFESGAGWIDYAGPPKTVPTYSFADVLEGRVDPSRLKGKIVVVGASAPALHDIQQTPFGGTYMPGSELQANAIATVLDGLPLSSAPGALEIALIVLLAAAATAAGFALRPIAAFLVALGVGALYLVAAQLAFNAGLVLTVVYPLLALLVAAIGILALQYLLVAFERQRVLFTFSRFVPEDVVDEVLANGEDDLQLGGVRRDCTVLFSDIRGFTSFSEARAPAEVVEVLNRYLSEMTDAVMDHGGTLVAYMGDGIMAVFGAPIEQDDHADRALAAAREMLEVRLPAFCEWMRESGYGDGFAIGIGLNSGEVLSGQVGSKRRMEYTTIGDTTNTASRLESMTKGSGFQIFIADSTREARTRNEPDLVEVGEREVRGREKLLRVWSLASESPAEAQR